MAKHSTMVKISFFGKKLSVDRVNIRSKALAADLVQKRNTIARYLSDFISEEIGLGSKLSAGQAKLFDNEKAAADAVINIDDFVKLTSAIPAASELRTAVGTAFFETKVSGLGGSSDIQFTSTTIARKDEQFGVVQGKLASTNKKEITGAAAVDLLFTEPFNSIRDNLLRNTIQKMENLLIISIAEKERTPVISYKFIPSPLPANSLTNKSIFSANYNVRIRPRLDKGEVVAYRVDISTNNKLKKDIDSRAVDITKQVRSLHSKGISLKLFNYLKKRIRDISGSSARDINEYLALAYAMANDFKVGGNTPFVLETRIQVPGASMSGATLNITGKAKNSRTVNKSKPQKFISSVQWTALVQNQLKQTMRKGGVARQPDLIERSGRFRGSVQVVPNYRANLLKFYYLPLYSHLQAYGYNPEQQIVRSIREVAQQAYARQFNIQRM